MFQRIVSLRVWPLFLLLALLLLPLPTAAQNGAGDIDNCCFVDRQCTTDNEWVSGYWAFQNNECTVASQPQQPAASAAVDNCCFIGWQCAADEEWTSGYWAFQNGQCATPSQMQRQSQQQCSPYPVRVVEDPITGATRHIYECGAEVTTRPSRQGEFCQTLIALELPLPPECGGIDVNQLLKSELRAGRR